LKTLTLASALTRSAKAIEPIFKITVTDYSGNPIVLSGSDILRGYSYSNSLKFGAASCSFSLRNPFSGNNITKYHCDSVNWGKGSTIRLEEGYVAKGQAEWFDRFSGTIRQMGYKIGNHSSIIDITAYDLVERLGGLDIDKIYEADTDNVVELLKPNPNETTIKVMAYYSRKNGSTGTTMRISGIKNTAGQDFYKRTKKRISKNGGVVYFPSDDVYCLYSSFKEHATGVGSGISLKGVDWNIFGQEDKWYSGYNEIRFLQSVSTIFDGSHQDWSDRPMPTLIWDTIETPAENSQSANFTTNFSQGQIVFSNDNPIDVTTWSLSGDYWYYPSGILLEDILQDILTQLDYLILIFMII